MITQLIFYPGNWTRSKLNALETILQKSLFKTALHRIAKMDSTAQCKQFALYLEENTQHFTDKQYLSLQIALQYVYLSHCISVSSSFGFTELLQFISNASTEQLSLAVQFIQENIHAFNTQELMRLSSHLTQRKISLA